MSSAEYLALLEKAHATTFAHPAYNGSLHTRALAHVGESTTGAALITFCPAVLGKTPDIDTLLLFFIKEFDAILKRGKEYVLIFCQSGLSSFKGIGVGFLRRVHNILGRSFKKNITGLYIVHPTNAVKTMLFFARPFVSKKFWKKVHYFSRTTQLLSSPLLANALYYPGAMGKGGQLVLPVHALAEDDGLSLEGNWAIRPYPIRFMGCPVSVQLQNLYGIPDFLSTCYQILASDVANLSIDGIFRISGDADEMNMLLRQFEQDGVKHNSTASVFQWYEGDGGQTESQATTIEEKVTSTTTTTNNNNNNNNNTTKIHIVCNIMKKFMREMIEPLFPHKIYEPMIHLFKTCKNLNAANHMNHMLSTGITSLFSQTLDAVAINNVYVFLSFLKRVAQQEGNRMNETNLAIVMAPNVLRTPPPPPLDPDADASVVQERTQILQDAMEGVQLTIQLLRWMVDNVDALFVVTAGGREQKDLSFLLWSIDTENIGQRYPNQKRPTQQGMVNVSMRNYVAVEEEVEEAAEIEEVEEVEEEVEEVEEQEEQEQEQETKTTIDRSKLQNLSEADRKSEFFKSMSAARKVKEEQKKTVRQEKLDAMDEEEQVAFLQSEQDEIRHAKQKDKSLKMLVKGAKNPLKRGKGKGRKGKKKGKGVDTSADSSER